MLVSIVWPLRISPCDEARTRSSKSSKGGHLNDHDNENSSEEDVSRMCGDTRPRARRLNQNLAVQCRAKMLVSSPNARGTTKRKKFKNQANTTAVQGNQKSWSVLKVNNASQTVSLQVLTRLEFSPKRPRIPPPLRQVVLAR